MYSTLSCSRAASTSAGLVLANSLGAKSSSAPAFRSTSTISFVESGLCALNNNASMTWDRFISICADCRLNGVCDSVGVFIDLIEFAAFDQKTNLGFSAGIAQKDAAFSGELAFHFVAQLHHFGQLFDRGL